MPPLGVFGTGQPHANNQRFGRLSNGAVATDYDGLTQYSERTPGLNGIADSKQGVVSLWFKPTAVAPPGVTREAMLFYDLRFGGGIEVDFVDANAGPYPSLYLGAFYSGGRAWSTDPTFAAPTLPVRNAWNHLLWSYDASIAAGKIYLNDVDVTPGVVTTNDFAVPFGSVQNFSCGISSFDGISGGMKGCLSEVFFDTSYLDLSVTANRRLFITAGLKPVNPGANTNALGYAPLLYVPDGKATNLGSGGNLTAFHNPPACTNAP